MKMLKYYLLKRAMAEPGFDVHLVIGWYAMMWHRYPNPEVCFAHIIKIVRNLHSLETEMERKHPEISAATWKAQRAWRRTEFRGWARALTAYRNLDTAIYEPIPF